MELMFMNLKILANFSQICQNEIIFRFGEISPFLLLHPFLDISQLFNPFTPMISLVILLTIFQTLLIVLVWRI